MKGLLIAAACLVAAASLTVRAQRQPSAPAEPSASPVENTDVHVLPVRGGIYMLVGPDGNAAASVGDDGVLLVDTMTAGSAPKLLAAVRTLSAKPIRSIINTSSHGDRAGGNPIVAKTGKAINGGLPLIYAFQESLMRLNGSSAGRDALPPEGWPTDSFYVKQKDIFFNGEPVQLFHEPSAMSDGDTIVMFRRSDVVVTGDVFTPQRYPMIDLGEGGSITGVVAALNHIIELTGPAAYEEGGTMVIPGHGHLCDEADVSDYRDMVTIVRDRIMDMVKKKKTLAEIQAAKPTFDYDGIYASSDYTGTMFVEAIYKTLTQTPTPDTRRP